MDTWILIGQGIILLGLLVIGLVYRQFRSYAEEKGKNLATKEDIGDITKTVESVKTNFAKELEEFREELRVRSSQKTIREASLHETRAMVIGKLDRLLHAAISETGLAMTLWRHTGGDVPELRAATELNAFFEEHQLYFSPEFVGLVLELIPILLRPSVYNLAKELDPPGGLDGVRDWVLQSWAEDSLKVSHLQVRIVHEMRKMLGVEDSSRPEDIEPRRGSRSIETGD